MMSNLSRRKYYRRRLAALTFLSTISLDGTHRDTPLGVLSLNVQYAKRDNVNTTKLPLEAKKSNEDTVSEDKFKQTNINYSRRLTISECTAELRVDRRDLWSSCEDKIGFDFRSRTFSKSKERVQKFVTDTKAKLCTLSQKRKHFVHQKSTFESLGLPAGLSTESLTFVPHSRKPSITIEMPPTHEAPEFQQLKKLYEQSSNERLILLTPLKAPFLVFSHIPYDRHFHGLLRGEHKTDGLRRRHNSSIRHAALVEGPSPLDLLLSLGIQLPEDGQDISFGHLLTSAHLPKRCQSYNPDGEIALPHHMHTSGCVSFDQAVSVRMCYNEIQGGPSTVIEKVNREPEVMVQCRHSCHSNPIYNPNLLDDPDLIAGKHSILLSFPSYVTSIINYVKPSDLKKDLNDRFKEKFPHICLTLSKLRSIKKEMLYIARSECNSDLSIVAQAFVYFEKLILKMLISKQNRKLCAGACLMLSAKLNDIKGADLRSLLERIETVFRVNRKDLVSLEFQVLVALEFSLHLSLWEVLPHYQRLMYMS